MFTSARYAEKAENRRLDIRDVFALSAAKGRRTIEDVDSNFRTNRYRADTLRGIATTANPTTATYVTSTAEYVGPMRPIWAAS